MTDQTTDIEVSRIADWASERIAAYRREGFLPPKGTGSAWGWNGDMCAVWGVAIILGETREEKERRARIIAEAMERNANA